MDDADILWTTCAGVLREQVSEAVWQTTFAGARPVRADEQAFVLAVPSTVVRERIEGRYLTLVNSALADAGGGAAALVIEVHTDDTDRAAELADMAEFSTVPAIHRDGAEPVDNGVATLGGPTNGSQPVNPRYTFEAFVIGVSNRFAHAAALSVAETPARSYNPLFIYGDAGLGKTHLLHAIGHYVNENFPAYTVRYVSTETFMNEFVDAIRTNSPAEFKKRYREVRRPPASTTSSSSRARRASRRSSSTPSTRSTTSPTTDRAVLGPPPPTPSPRSRTGCAAASRWGLITDVQPAGARDPPGHPAQEGRDRAHHAVPADVLEFIATHVTDNIRELEGALIRVCAYASLNQESRSTRAGRASPGRHPERRTSPARSPPS